MGKLIDESRDLARLLMEKELSQRWAHVQAVAARAEEISPAIEGAGELLTSIAWLHDIGYASVVSVTGFHPLDGADYLRRKGFDLRICQIVANHSAAAIEAELRELDSQMLKYPDEKTILRDAVWYCDMTTSPKGEPITFPNRLQDIFDRYGEEHSVSRAFAIAAPEIELAISRVEKCIKEKLTKS